MDNVVTVVTKDPGGNVYSSIFYSDREQVGSLVGGDYAMAPVLGKIYLIYNYDAKKNNLQPNIFYEDYMEYIHGRVAIIKLDEDANIVSLSPQEVKFAMDYLTERHVFMSTCQSCFLELPKQELTWVNDNYSIPFKLTCGDCYDAVEREISGYRFDPTYAGEYLDEDY